MNYYKLDLASNPTAPDLAWDAMVAITELQQDLISDV